MKSNEELFAELIFMNECGDRAHILALTDPDGIRSGKSGYSFGKVQMDTRNNPASLKCLKECGFTQDEIHGVVDQACDVRPLNAKLLAHPDIVEKYDEAQLAHCFNHVASKHIAFESPGGILALADYVNQYGSIGPQFMAYIDSLHAVVNAEDVLMFKLDHTKYGKEHPKDCKRRYNNLMSLLKNGRA